VANGVSLNLLGLLAWHSFRRGTVRGVKAALLLGSVPVAILATMTRAVWLSFAATVLLLIVRSRNGMLRRACLGLAIVGGGGFLIVVSIPELQRTLAERMEERGPVDFREAVYAGGWQMFLERPVTGWGVNQMPGELARHVSGYKERALYQHNTYLELLVEHGIAGLALYAWLMWEIWRLGRGSIPREESRGFLDRHFHSLWPLLLGVYWINAALVVMNYQFVNGLLFTLAGMLAAQRKRAEESAVDWNPRPEASGTSI
jgi:O-antigen ligase